MSGYLARRKRRRAGERFQCHLDAAAEELHGIVLAADLDYAFWDPEQQDGEAGERHGAATEKLRQAVTLLRGLDLPDVEELG